jgi:hypothetical protein
MGNVGKRRALFCLWKGNVLPAMGTVFTQMASVLASMGTVLVQMESVLALSTRSHSGSAAIAAGLLTAGRNLKAWQCSFDGNAGLDYDMWQRVPGGVAPGQARAARHGDTRFAIHLLHATPERQG